MTNILLILMPHNRSAYEAASPWFEVNFRTALAAREACLVEIKSQ